MDATGTELAPRSLAPASAPCAEFSANSMDVLFLRVNVTSGTIVGRSTIPAGFRIIRVEVDFAPIGVHAASSPVASASAITAIVVHIRSDA